MAISDLRDKDLARLLVRHSVKAKKGDIVYVEGIGVETLGLIEALVEEIAAAGASPFLHIVEPEILRRFVLSGNAAIFENLLPVEMGIMEKTNCYIGIRGSQNIFEMSDVPRKTMDAYNKLLAVPVRHKRVRDTRWCVLRYPNASMAQLSQQSREGFADFYYRVCTLDYGQMAKALKPLQQLMEKTDQVHIKGPGTDLRFSIRNIGVVPCTGEYNIPDGECFTAPIRDSVNGTVLFNAPSVNEGTGYENIHLTFRDGKIVDARAANKEQTTKLNKVLDQDEGARYVGEFSLAFNPYILHPMRDILFDEKIAGSFHMAMGQAYDQANNGNNSGLHWDMVCIQRPDYGGGEITFDGKLIRKDGLFLPKSLQGLNPDAFSKTSKKSKGM